MKYTIKVNELNKESNIKVMASVVFGDSFKVGNIAVVERKDGELFVAMPQFRSNSKDKHGNDVYKSVCNPITKEFRQELFDNILATYASEQKERTIDTKDVNDLQFKVSVIPYERQGNIRGIGRIYFNDNFVVNNVSVLQGKENLFVAMPSYKTKQTNERGKAIYQDICYPVTKEFRKELYEEIEHKYKEALEKKQEQERNKAQSEVKDKSNEQFVKNEEQELPFR